MRTVLRHRLGQVRRYIGVVVAVTLLAVSAAVFSSLAAGTTYTAKSALVVSSPGRAPDQDAVMAVGYATLFNDPATIARLRAAKAIPADIDFEARTAAASPIVTIEATANDPKAAQDTAQTMAEAFRDDMNAAPQKATQDSLASLQRQLDQLRAQPGPDGAPNPSIGPLQDRIETMRFDSTNQLRDLQLRAGVSKSSPKIVLNVALGLLGGLMLGVLAAFGLAAVSNRLTSPAELREKTGIEPLVELPHSGFRERHGLREERLRTLANMLNARGLPTPTVLAVADTRGARGARQIAEALATLSARQGRRTVLVFADNDPEESAEGAGFNDALSESRISGALLKPGPVDGLTILTAGSTLTDRYPLLTHQRVNAVLDQLRAGADTVIVAAPSVTETTDAQVICAAADVTVLVVAKKSSRADEVVSAAETLAAARAPLAGAVLIGRVLDERSPSRSGGNPPAHHRSRVSDVVKA